MRFIHVTLHVKPDMVPLYESTFFRLQDEVRKHEPGCRMLEFCRDPSDPLTYHVLEAYDDEAAVEAHVTTDYYLETADIFIRCLQGDHMKEIEARGLSGRAMYALVDNIDFQRMETISR